MITITDKGAEKVREFLAAQGADIEAAGLRVGVRGGGCSGFQYNLAFDQQRDGDAVFEARGLKLLVDRPSLPYVTGSIIDYVDSMQGAGFQVNNPNVVAACGCGSSFRGADEGEGSGLSPLRPPRAAAAGGRGSEPAAPPLLLGVTEGNPYLLAPGRVPERFEPWRDALARLHPRYLRLLVVWSRVQPHRGAPPDWAAPADGCLRGRRPCAAFAGVRDQLRAARAAGLQVVVTILATPPWASARAAGCERPATSPRSRMPADLGDYRALVRSLLAEARRVGVELRWWSPWNEPNHPAFLNPQRAGCSPAAPAPAP